MGLLFGSNDDKIEELEKRVDELKTEVTREKRKRNQLEQAIEDLPDYVEARIEAKENNGEYQTLPDAEGKVITLNCPYVAWKHAGGKLVKLVLPRGTDVVYPIIGYPPEDPRKKLRASEAKVLDIQKPHGGRADTLSVRSNWDQGFEYEIGETVRPDWFDDDIGTQCSHGIHLYRTRQAAKMTM